MNAELKNDSGEQIAGRAGANYGDAAMLSVKQVAKILNCSTRHVYRMSNAARMPRLVKLGSLVRWPKKAIEVWVANGNSKQNDRIRRQIKAHYLFGDINRWKETDG